MVIKVSEESDASVIIAENSSLKMEVAGSSEISGDIYQTVRCDVLGLSTTVRFDE
jgi:hypothetical protein